jgi:CHAT domain/SIR2-like domain
MALRTLQFRVSDDRVRPRVRLTVGNAAPVEDDFEQALLTTPRLQQVIAQIELGRCKLDDLRDVGTHLWDALLPRPLYDTFESARAAARAAGEQVSIRLSLPPHVEPLPWEALYDEKRRVFISVEHNHSVVRSGADDCPAPSPERRARPLSVLVVIPEGSALLVDHEWNNLRLAVGPLGDAIRLERLDGRITAQRLLDKLRTESWDVLHYIGHGELGAEGTVRIRLNGEGTEADYWMEAEPFSMLFDARPPRLVILNCCLGALPDPRRTLGGLGPLLMRRGVPAVVSMRYEIQDDVAIKFTDNFYRELLTGESPGRVDLAMRHARLAIHSTQAESSVRGFVTPVLHLADGCEVLFDVPARTAAPLPVVHVETPVDVTLVPPELIDAVKQRDCVLVVGSIFGSSKRSAGNGGPAIPGQRELALELATASQYPLMSDFDMLTSGESWLLSTVLSSVCQHFQKVNRRRRPGLIQAIQQTYQKCIPREPLLTIAQWDAPGIVYTHFDGLMEEAFKSVRKAARIVPSVEQAPDAGEDEVLLVHLRGTIKDERSLVLTEEDHDRLWDALGRLPSRIANLARGTGRSVLLLGVSPRDPLIRRLSMQLLETGDNRLQGPTYFVCSSHTTVDDAYWSKYDVKWIEAACDDVVASIARELQGQWQ